MGGLNSLDEEQVWGCFLILKCTSLHILMVMFLSLYNYVQNYSKLIECHSLRIKLAI
jgi:hypothetical protein